MFFQNIKFTFTQCFFRLLKIIRQFPYPDPMRARSWGQKSSARVSEYL